MCVCMKVAIICRPPTSSTRRHTGLLAIFDFVASSPSSSTHSVAHITATSIQSLNVLLTESQSHGGSFRTDRHPQHEYYDDDLEDEA